MEELQPEMTYAEAVEKEVAIVLKGLPPEKAEAGRYLVSHAMMVSAITIQEHILCRVFGQPVVAQKRALDELHKEVIAVTALYGTPAAGEPS